MPRGFGGVARRSLEAGEERAGVEAVGLLVGGEVGQLDALLAEPLAVGAAGGDVHLELFVVDDAAFLEIDEEHAAGLEATFFGDRFGGDGEDADFGGHDDEIIFGDVVAGGAEAVAVERGADVVPVGKRDGRRAVPGLHQAGVVLVEIPLGQGHGLVVLPGLGDHHHDRFGQRAPGEHEELQHVVEHARVGSDRVDKRVGLGEVFAEEDGLHESLAGAHPVDVAAEGVDFAVVAHVAHGLGAVP